MGNEQGKNGRSSGATSQQQQQQQRASGPRAKCTPKKHVSSQMQLCANGSCNTQVCGNCLNKGPSDNKFYCQMCFISISNLAGGDSSDDDDMAFGSSSGSASTGFQKTQVKRDADTGEITGWQEFYQLASQNSNMQQEESKHTAMFNLAQEQLAASTQPSYVVLKQQDRLEERIVMIKNELTGQIIEVQAVQTSGTQVDLRGLPEEVNAYNYNYTHQERWENLRDVIECLVTMHSVLSGGQTATPLEEEGQSMPSTIDFQRDLAEYAVFRQEDPSVFYNITSQYKLGSGGFAKVFKVMRKSDSKVIALKFIQNLKDEREKQLMHNEVALMNMCQGNDFVLRIFEQYEYKECLWIFVEIMDDALTPVIARMRNVYTENCCKYILRQTLLGLSYLHARHIIHRDIKSDNILIDKEGQVKLADFGYSAQLTTERDARSSKVGTVCWMAPELIKGERKYDTKVDIWSFGIVAMELANGDPPYISEPQQRVIMNIIKKPTPPLESRWSSSFQDFVNKSLLKDPKLRWSADQLLEHEWLQGAADHKQEFGQLVQTFCVQRDEAKARRKKK